MENVSNRSMAELFGDLGRDIAALLRKEIELARLELGRIGSVVARRAVFVAVGAALCLAGLLSLLATSTLGLMALGLSPLAASAIVTGVVLVVGGALVASGISALKKESLVPTETIQTLKDASEVLRASVTSPRAVGAVHVRSA